MTFQDVVSVIHDEHVYGMRKWGGFDEHPHEVGAWMTAIRSHLRKAEDAWASQSGDIGALEELRKVAALCVSCMMQHGAVPRSAYSHATVKSIREERT